MSSKSCARKELIFFFILLKYTLGYNIPTLHRLIHLDIEIHFYKVITSFRFERKIYGFIDTVSSVTINCCYTGTFNILSRHDSITFANYRRK